MKSSEESFWMFLSDLLHFIWFIQFPLSLARALHDAQMSKFAATAIAMHWRHPLFLLFLSLELSNYMRAWVDSWAVLSEVCFWITLSPLLHKSQTAIAYTSCVSSLKSLGSGLRAFFQTRKPWFYRQMTCSEELMLIHCISSDLHLHDSQRSEFAAQTLTTETFFWKAWVTDKKFANMFCRFYCFFSDSCFLAWELDV